MMQWKLIALHEGDEVMIDLLSKSDDQNHLRETCSIEFQVAIEDQAFQELGTPYVVLSDIPIELKFSHYDGKYHNFKSTDELGSHSSRYFYNFFGESDIGLCFSNHHCIHHSHKINILARRENAELAHEMLNYITSHLEDAVSICFSRSKRSVGYDPSNNFSFSRLDIIQEAVTYLSEALPIFVKEHKYAWKPEILLSELGQPTGPDSVYWALNNLDQLSPANVDEANLIYNNRGYRLDALPKETLVKEKNVFENQVIHTFLHNMILFLFEIKEQFSEATLPNNEPVEQEYVRFDHTMRQYTQLVLRHKINHIDTLVAAIEQLKRVFSVKIPARLVPGIQPKFTSYVVRHLHYRKTFELIDLCYRAPSPSFEGESLLLGLKNLSIIYETSSLLILHETILRCFQVELHNQCFKLHAEHYPFGGIERERPQGEVNNHFRYASDTFNIELLYEPKIYPFTKLSSPGDLVDTSLSNRTEYGAHHFCPDFIMKIESKNWYKPITIILDSKYKDASTIRRFDIDTLTRKYLLNIHQVNARGGLGISPVNLLLLMFPHERSGHVVNTVAKQHSLNGPFPILPQSRAILVKPSQSNLLDEHFNALIRLMDEEKLLIT